VSRTDVQGPLKDRYSAPDKTFCRVVANLVYSSKASARNTSRLRITLADRLWSPQRAFTQSLTTSFNPRSSIQLPNSPAHSISEYKVSPFPFSIRVILMTRLGSMWSWLCCRPFLDDRCGRTLLSYAERSRKQWRSRQESIWPEPVYIPHCRLDVSTPSSV
jgi:hypothetical protein